MAGVISPDCRSGSIYGIVKGDDISHNCCKRKGHSDGLKLIIKIESMEKLNEKLMEKADDSKWSLKSLSYNAIVHSLAH